MSWWSRSTWGQKDATAWVDPCNDFTPVKFLDAPGDRKRIVIDDLTLGSLQCLGANNVTLLVQLYGGEPATGGIFLIAVSVRQEGLSRTIDLYDIGIPVPTNAELWVRSRGAGLALGTGGRLWLSYHLERAGAE